MIVCFLNIIYILYVFPRPPFVFPGTPLQIGSAEILPPFATFSLGKL